jgi:antirestriction protein
MEHEQEMTGGKAAVEALADNLAPENVEQEPEGRVPRIYVASLSDYNAGRLHGAWLDATGDYDTLHAGVEQMLGTSPEPAAEEWAIHDYEGFGGLLISEYESLSTVSTVAQGIVEHGPAFAAWADYVDKDPQRLEQFDEAYRGEWPSMIAYAENLADDFGIEDELDRHFDALRAYIFVDYDGLARDLELSGDYYTKEADNGSVYVFCAL